jgi:DNA-binding CsgD family transcriptional regulator
MSLLSQNEYELFLNCIRELHAFRDLNALRSWLLDTALPQLIPSDWLSYNEVDLLNPANTLAILKPESSTIFQQLFPRFREVVHQHPLINRQLASADFPVHKISDFLSQESYHRLELYQDVYRQMGVEYQIAATIKLEPHRITAFALSRQQTDYTERDRAILEMLRPHRVVAFNNLALAREHQAILDTATLALNEVSSATIIVDPHGCILYHTGPGLRWIGATSPGILPATVLHWLKLPAISSARENMSLFTDAGEIRLRSVPTSHGERLLLVLTLVNDRRPAAAFLPVSGLSKRESEVAHWVCIGKSNAEIAGILGISPRTVHKHLEHIFEKLGVETRLALARRMLDAAAPLRGPATN